MLDLRAYTDDLTVSNLHQGSVGRDRDFLSNVVETALAKALVLAAEAKQWEVVMQIADELEARRLSMPRARRRASLAR